MCKSTALTEINRTDRNNRAFSAADKLNFDGDVQAFQIKATAVIRELTAAKCTVVDYFLHRMMRAFDGKNKSIQYKIANDMKSMVINKDSNIYDMIQSYCADIAAVGDRRQGSVHTVDSKEGCAYCHIRGHEEEDCRRKKADSNGNKGGTSGGHKQGHRESECRKRNMMLLLIPQVVQVAPRLLKEETTPNSNLPMVSVRQSLT